MEVPHWDIEVLDTDVLVLGGGLAGLRAAASARTAGVSVVQAFHGRGASQHIIGFNVPLGHADPRDSPQAYFEDTIAGGYELNDPRLVGALADGACPTLEELVSVGVPFAREGTRFAQRLLSGNRYPRSVYHPNGVGRLALERLSAHCRAIGVSAYSGWKAIGLLRDGLDVVGALLVKLSSARLLAVHARATVLATGGIGAIYADSTYPLDVASDSYALALGAGAALIDMEFVQFEPTVVVHPEGCRGMEMPTAMFGDGARLLNAAGERFMFRYNPEHGEKRIEKARIALCIQREIDEGRGMPDGTVVFDTITVLPERLESYMSHCRRLRAAGVEPLTTAPRVRPAAHSLMGGIRVDATTQTSVSGLFAAGEAAGGVHGASRLAGNGASDALVFGGISGRAAAAFASRAAKVPRNWASIHADALSPLQDAWARTDGPEPNDIKKAVRGIMPTGAGIYRSRDSLLETLSTLDLLRSEVDGGLRTSGPRDVIRAIEAANMVLSASLVARSALERTESRGAHQRTDYPKRDDANWLRHVTIETETGVKPAPAAMQ